MATDILFPEWNIWTQFLDFSTEGLSMDALEISHPIEVECSISYTKLAVLPSLLFGKMCFY